MDIKIGKKDDIGKDEWWCNWYKCPNCGENNIARCFDYCPNCGRKIKWQEEE